MNTSFFSFLKQDKSIFILFVLAFLIAVFDFNYLIFQCYLPYLKGNPDMYDFTHYYKAANEFLFGNRSMYYQSLLSETPRYIYPPPNILIFIPFVFIKQASAYMLFNAFGLFAFILSVHFLVKSIQKYYGIIFEKNFLTVIYVLSLSFAPLVQNLKAGQVNSLVLLTVSLAIYFMVNKKIFWAVIFVALGFWMKVYPAILILLFLKKENLKPLIYGVLAGFIALPILLLPIIPLSEYTTYMFDIFPKFSNMLIIGSFNQSFSVFLMRIGLPVESHSSWIYSSIPKSISIANSISALVVLAFIMIKYYKNKFDDLMVASLLISITCIFTPIGWEYTFVMALPLFLLVFISNYKLDKKYLYINIFVILMFMIPKVPDGIVEKLYVLPKIFILLFFVRFSLAIILSMFLLNKRVNKTGIAK